MIEKIQKYLDGLAGGFIKGTSYVDDYWPNGQRIRFRDSDAYRYSAYVADQSTAKELADRMHQKMTRNQVPFNFRCSSHRQSHGRNVGQYKIEIYFW